jgi:hypothetical protein
MQCKHAIVDTSTLRGPKPGQFELEFVEVSNVLRVKEVHCPKFVICGKCTAMQRAMQKVAFVAFMLDLFLVQKGKPCSRAAPRCWGVHFISANRIPQSSFYVARQPLWILDTFGGDA